MIELSETRLDELICEGRMREKTEMASYSVKSRQRALERKMCDDGKNFRYQST